MRGQESQLKALKDTVHICFSAVLHNQPSSSHRFPSSPSHLFRYSSLINSSRLTFQQPHAKVFNISHSSIWFNVIARDGLGVVKNSTFLYLMNEWRDCSVKHTSAVDEIRLSLSRMFPSQMSIYTLPSCLLHWLVQIFLFTLQKKIGILTF